MYILVRSFLMSVAIFVATMEATDAQGCTIKRDCENHAGYCILQTDADTCPGVTYNVGCSGDECTCCIENLVGCLPKPKCYNNKGACMQVDWTDCVGAVDSSGCHGDNCACCHAGACSITNFCKNNGGYCIFQESNHQCPGTVYNKGCSGDDCACCFSDTSLCIEKPHCENDGGFCIQNDWTVCEGEVDSSGCHGDNCACCKNNDCTATQTCIDANGYCFKTTSNHKCDGLVTSDCTGDNCLCCCP